MKKHKSKFWFKNEKELMKSLGLKGTPGSGNKIIKEDGQNEHFIAQLKSTDGNQVTIKLTDVNSLLYNAAVTHKIPIFINQFVDGPVLISMCLNDVDLVCDFLQGKSQHKETTLDEVQHVTVNKKVIKSGNRTKVMNEIKKQKEKQYKERRKK